MEQIKEQTKKYNMKILIVYSVILILTGVVMYCLGYMSGIRETCTMLL